MKKEKIKPELEKILKAVFPDGKSLTLEKPRSEFENWDSLTHMQLVSEIESKFGVSFEMEEIAEISKAGEFLPLIEKKLK